MKISEKPFFSLLDLAYYWGKEFINSDSEESEKTNSEKSKESKKISLEELEEKILSYGANGSLPIYVSIPNYVKMEVCIMKKQIEIKNYFDEKTLSKTYDQYISKNILNSEIYSGEYLERISSEDIRFLLHSEYKHIHLKYLPYKRKKIIKIITGNYCYNSRYPIIRIEDLRIKYEDILKFEQQYFKQPKEDTGNSNKKHKRMPKFDTDFQYLINHEYQNNRKTPAAFTNMLKEHYSEKDPYMVDDICTEVYYSNKKIFYNKGKNLSETSLYHYFKRAKDSKKNN